MRKLEFYVKKYGPEAGRKLFHALQSQAAHAGVSARLRKKIGVLTGKIPAPVAEAPEAPKPPADMPLFPELDSADEAARVEAVFSVNAVA